MKSLDMSRITDQLYVGRTPRRRDYQTLADVGITLLINMRAEWPSPIFVRQNIMQDIWVPCFDLPLGFVGQKRLLATALLAKQEIERGGKVYVFCHKGRHRSVAMASAVLLLQGYSLAKVQALFVKQRPVSDLKRYQVHRAVSRFAKNV